MKAGGNTDHDTNDQLEISDTDSETITLPGCETADADRAQALGLAQAEELTKILHSPKADVSGKAGDMERNAPLFFGQGIIRRCFEVVGC